MCMCACVSLAQCYFHAYMYVDAEIQYFQIKNIHSYVWKIASGVIFWHAYGRTTHAYVHSTHMESNGWYRYDFIVL